MKFLAIVVVGMVFLTGCRKSQRDADTSVLATTDQTTLDVLLSGLFHMMDEAARKEYGIISSYNTQFLLCTVVSDNLNSNPQTIVVDFGPQCDAPDNRVYRGKVHMTMTGGDYLDSGTVTTIQFIDFFVDEIELYGKITMTNKGNSSNGNPYFNIRFTNFELSQTTGDPWNATYTANLNREMIVGSSTPEVSDDIYKLSGKGSGRSRSGNTYTYAITDSLVINHTCAYFITSGMLELEPDNLAPRYIDYGYNCDSKAFVKFNDILHEVTLP